MARMRSSIVAAAATIAALAAPTTASAATVTDCDDLQTALDTQSVVTLAEGLTCNGSFDLPASPILLEGGGSGATLSGDLGEDGRTQILSGTDVGATTIRNLTFINGQADETDGGAIDIEGDSPVTIEDNDFIDNEALTGEGGGRGGAVALELDNQVFAPEAARGDTSPIVLRGNTFGGPEDGNHADDRGGAVFIDAFFRSVVVDDNVFEQNEADENGGGGLYIDASQSVTLSGNVFEDNRGGDDGGGANVDTCAAEITSNVFDGNRIEAVDATLDGAGLYLIGSRCDIVPDEVARGGSAAAATQEGNLFVDNEIRGEFSTARDAGEFTEDLTGTLDLFRGPGGGVRQAVWPGGEPATPPRPDETPSGPEVVDRSGFGSSFTYAYEKTHQHFHFSAAARYELVPQGAAARASDKVGFCMFDSFGPANHFAYSVQGADDETWCGFNRPLQQTVRMGLSPGGADVYSAQRERQWVDISGVEPGPAAMRAEANPLRCILESDEANNTTSETRQVPGVRVAGAAGSTAAGTPVALALSGTVVAADVPARRSGGCQPGRTSTECYVWASAAGPLSFTAVGEPAHGALALAPDGGLRATATYTPDPGFAGEDSFTYTATDARGLSSRPATARVTVAAPPAGAAVPAPARRAGCRGGSSAGCAAAGRRTACAPAAWPRGRHGWRSAAWHAGATGCGCSWTASRPAQRPSRFERGAASRLGAAWLPSDTSRWAGFRSAGAPRSPSRR
jgi:parallel beta-helix repeat protein